MQVKSGDLICFSGNDWVCDAINLATFALPRHGIHHVGIVCLSVDGCPLVYEAIGCEGTRPMPCERSGLVGAGFQAHYLDDVLDMTDQRVFHLPLRRALYWHEEERLGNFLDSMIGRPYDKLGAARSGGLVFRILQSFLRREDLAGLFCSEASMSAIVDIGLFSTRSAGLWNPNSMTRFLRAIGLYGQYILLKERHTKCVRTDAKSAA